MTVYLVTDGDDMALSGTYIYGVFSTRELAEAFVQRRPAANDLYVIEEWTVDEVPEQVPQ